MSNRIFLGGTCNGTTWRDELIKGLTVDYFNPVVEDWTEEALDKTVRDFVEETGFKMGMVAQPLRVAVTGGTSSPGINETLFLVGRERALQRIENALAEIPD